MGGPGQESDTWRHSPGRGNLGSANQDEALWHQSRRDPLNMALPGYADMDQGASGGRPLEKSHNRVSAGSGVIGSGRPVCDQQSTQTTSRNAVVPGTLLPIFLSGREKI